MASAAHSAHYYISCGCGYSAAVPGTCISLFFSRVLDPSGVILQIVCEPVRKYLRTREDTVRCIVQSLIDDGSSELSEELTKGQGICLEESFEDEEDKGITELHCIGAY